MVKGQKYQGRALGLASMRADASCSSAPSSVGQRDYAPFRIGKKKRRAVRVIGDERDARLICYERVYALHVARPCNPNSLFL